ncbi:glycosyltransferase family 2 protein [Sulfuricurvum sp.]|uniref:glycosyltransferase family 2 protein n=1 Tax=Sulfuricurvum sp. TaxID=2025608 RepID=UPI003C607E99
MTFDKLCILIPVYNNPKTIAHVVHEAGTFALPIIIIDDGSDILVETLLETDPSRFIVRHPVNQGKGVALRTGAKRAKELGFEYCLTMDGDGQHFADDIPRFLDLFEKEKNTNMLIIGVRDFETCNPPTSSSIGRRLGNFWVWVETGIWVSDTQTGFRLYPVECLLYPSSAIRYEFETENIVRFLWSGGTIFEVMVKTVYDESRVTHFHKLKDNFFMVILHTKLVLSRIFLLKGILK